MRVVIGCAFFAALAAVAMAMNLNSFAPSVAIDMQASYQLEAQSCWFESAEAEQCYSLRIDQAGQQFVLPVVVLRGNKTTSSEAVLYLSGGPGGSTYLNEEDMNYWRGLHQRLDLAMDLVLVDRRGTGLAQPLLQCNYYRREYRIALTKNLTAQAENEQAQRTLSWCLEEQLSAQGSADKIAVAALGTGVDAVDMVSLLNLLGYQQWHLWGVSYGTRLALAIAALQPAGLQSLALDSVYPPGRGQSEEWPGLMSAAINRFFHWCDVNHCAREQASAATATTTTTTTTTTATDSRHSEQAFNDLLTWLDENPQSLDVASWYGEAPYRIVVNGQRFLQIVFSAIYDQYLWQTIALSLRELPQGNQQALQQLVDNFVNNAFAPDFSELVFYTAECKDNPPMVVAEMEGKVAKNPLYQHYLEGIAQWDICRAAVFDDARGTEIQSVQSLRQLTLPILMLSGELDPITPQEWTADLHALLPRWQQANFAKVGHAVVSSSDCAERLLADFLADSKQALRLVSPSCVAESVSVSHSLPIALKVVN